VNFSKKIAMGIWINDIKNTPLSGSNWPDVSIDGQLLDDCNNIFNLIKKAGYDSVDLFGLLAGHDWPPNIESVFKDNRKEQVNQIIEMAHSKGIDIIFGMGIYSWGFDEIIRHDPEVRGTNPSAMCGSSEASKKWQEKVIEFVASNIDVDGFHLEASDQGRCSCEKCAKENNVEYYSRLNKEAAIFIKDRWPDKYLLVNDCGYMAWGDFVDKKDFKYLYDLGNHIDAFIDNGNHGLFINESDRKEFIKGLNCEFGSAGGFWVYPPQRWDRLRWFLPYIKKTGNFLKSLHDDGGRVCEFYLGPTINPGTEINIYAGGLILSGIERNLESILKETLKKLYKPYKDSYLESIAEIFLDAEDAFFNNWEPCIKPFELPEEFAADVETLVTWSKNTPERTVPGELFLEPLVGIGPGEPIYLINNMTEKGRKSYKKDLEGIIMQIEEIKEGFDDGGRISRIITCIKNVIADINIINK